MQRKERGICKGEKERVKVLRKDSRHKVCFIQYVVEEEGVTVSCEKVSSGL